jgi:ABC-2 type transport system permease protein
MPAGLKTLQQDVTDKLSELSIASKGRLEYQIVDPKATEELEQSLLDKGVRPFQVQSVERDAIGVKLVYSAISIGYKDEAEEILPQVLPDNLASFEYELLSRVVKLVRDTDPIVAVYSTKETLDPQLASFYLQSGQPLPEPPDPFQSIPEFLRGEGYDVRSTQISADNPVPDSTSTLLVLGPRELSERQRWEIARVLRRGGNVIVAAQATTYDYNPGPRGGFSINVRGQSLGINDLLTEYGVRIDDRLLMDAQMATLAIPRETNIGGMRFQTNEPVQAPMQIRVLGDGIHRDLPLVAGVPELLYLWGNQLIVDTDGLAAKDLTATTVFTGSKDSWIVDKKSGALDSPDLQPEGHTPQPEPTLAVLIEGVFPDPWAASERPSWPEGATDSLAAAADDVAGPEMEPKRGRLFVVGCSKLFEEMLLDQAGHALFLLNSVDALTLGDDLISIRSKRFDQRTFGEVSDGKKLAFRFLNIALVPLLVAALGLGTHVRRRREADEYAAKHSRSSGGATS